MTAELLVVALEASADLHGAAVLRELRTSMPRLRAFGAGGPRMRAEGFEALVQAEDLSVMGVADVIAALPTILESMEILRDAARDRRPRAALLIDSPDFNLRLARRLRELRIPIAYFIGPSVWAWRAYRVRQIARDVAKMLVILPFEAKFYAERGVSAVYVGNPLADSLRAGNSTFLQSIQGGPRPHPMAIVSKGSDMRASLGLDPGRPLLALLPGSRVQELRRLWPILLSAARTLKQRMAGLQLAVPVAPTLRRDLFGEAPEVAFYEGRAPELLAAATVALVTSGTATLEAALAQTPLVCVYRTSWMNWLLGRLFVRVRHLSLVNLLAGRALIPELLQSACTPRNVASAALPLLSDTRERAAQLEGMRQLREELAPQGSTGAARRAAEEVRALLEAP